MMLKEMVNKLCPEYLCKPIWVVSEPAPLSSLQIYQPFKNAVTAALWFDCYCPLRFRYKKGSNSCVGTEL